MLLKVRESTKEIHYYKNIKSVFHHYSIDKSKDAWNVLPSINNSHVLAHFRSEWKYGHLNGTGSIQKLNLDFEYIFYTLKHFTLFCNSEILFVFLLS
jgi:hypothetical protein